MRVAALYDIHGNFPALEAVMSEVREAGVDQIVVGGDVLLGPIPGETLAYLDSIDIPIRFISGNCDRLVVELRSGKESNEVPEAVRANLRWVAEQITTEDQVRIADWPKTVTLHIDGAGEVLFCHATPRNDTEIFTRLTAEDRLLPVFDSVNASMVVCGHSHMQFDRTIGRVRVVNAGSVGMPFGTPGADWLLLGPDVELRHTSYDLARAADRIRATGYPQAEEFAARNVLQPPTEDAMLQAFSRTELK
jgi:putative phosphoesterase